MKILIAGIGNIFYRDDAFGCEVIRELEHHELPEEVTAADFGIRGYDLAYALTNDFDAVILVDAAPRGGVPGTLYLIEPDANNLSGPQNATMDNHAMSPVAVIQMAKSLGHLCEKLFLIGCEPEIHAEEEGEIGLSPKVRKAIPQALTMIDSLVGNLLGTYQQEQETAGFVPA